MKARDVKGTRSAKIVEQRGRILPKQIYGKWMWRDSDDPWLECSEEIEWLAEKGEVEYVGEYKLVAVRKVKLYLEVA